MSISSELYINISNKPKWEEGLGYYNQTVDVQQFYKEEAVKATKGVVVNGVKIHPWLYWHINFWQMFVDVKRKDGSLSREPMRSHLRDNEWFINENLLRAEADRKGIIMFGTRRFGKALRNDSILYLKNGSTKTIGNAKVGDLIYGADGELTKIKGVYPQGKLDLYKVTFQDGRSIECCDEHLWTVLDYQSKTEKVLPLKQIIKSRWKFNRIRKDSNKKATVYNYYIPITKPVKFNELDLPIDPYILGLWLGDGDSKNTRITTEDSEIVESITRYAKSINHSVTKSDISYKVVNSKGKNNKLRDALKLINVFGNKHIPTLYKRASVEQRLELVRGLMDSDGYISKGGAISFTQTNKLLFTDMYEVLLSLGIKTELVEDYKTNYKDINNIIFTSNRINIFTDQPIFKLNRKLSRLKKKSNRNRTKIDYVAIVNIEKVNQGLATCIRVDNEDSLFLTNDYVVTHNSAFISSYIAWNATFKYGGTNSVVGGVQKDLDNITQYIDFGLDNVPEFFQYDRVGADWSKGVTLGTRQASNKKNIFSTMTVTNVNMGKQKSTQKTAGATPSSFVMDEVGKYPCKKVFNTAKYSFSTQFGWRCIPILIGCVVAGTKVWDNSGNLVNIEDLKKEQGIIGYNGTTYSKEDITYQQKGYEKPCYRITTNSGRVLECSEDHPILFRSRNEIDYSKGRTKGVRKVYFKPTNKLKLGNQVAIIDQVDIYSNKEMWNPRLVGLLIGDGSYGRNKTPILSSCDTEVNKYIDRNFDTVIEKSNYTKDGRLYRETRIKGITTYLRELGIYGQTKGDKTLPLNVHSYSKNTITELLGGLFDADGCVHTSKSNNMITLTSGYKNLLEEVRLLLNKLGIHCLIKYTPTFKKNTIDKNGWFTLSINDKKSLDVFHNEIKLLIKYKQKNLDTIHENLKNRNTKIPKEIKGLRFEKITNIEFIGNQVVYNLTANTTHTYVANGIVTHNTGGEVDEAQDAQSIVGNPEIHNLITMDWNLLKRNCKNPTWTEKNWGIFVPAQMSMESGLIKKEVKLSSHLGVEGEGLDKINIKVTDWEIATSILEARRAELKEKDPSSHIDEMMFLPLDTDDCFLQTSANPFPSVEATIHRRKLVESGNTGKAADIYRKDGTTKLGYEYSDKPLAKFPYEGGIIDAPILIFEDPPVDNTPDSTYVGGLDHYKHTEAGTDSVGSYYVFKRMVNLNDPWANRIVASYNSRPSSMVIFNTKVEQLMEGYGAETLQENADISFQQHLDAKHKTAMWLANGEELAKSQINRTARQSNKYGLPPTPKNQQYLLNLVIHYCQEEINMGEDENGDAIIVKGVERIPDIYLLDEIIGFKYGKNHDRIISFGHALAWARYLDSMNIMPKVRENTDSNQYRKQVRQNKLKNKSPYGGKRFSPY